MSGGAGGKVSATGISVSEFALRFDRFGQVSVNVARF